MVLKGFVNKEEFEGLDPVLQGEYKEEGEGHVLSVKAVNGWGFGQIDGLKTTATKERGNAKKYYTQLRQYQDEDGEFIDPEAAKEAMANKEKYLETSKDKVTVDDQVKERMKGAEDNWKKELKKRDDKIVSLTTVIRKEKVDNSIKTAVARKKGKSYLPKILKNQMEMRENDAGELYQVILDDDGNEMYSAKDPSKLMDLDEHLEIMANNEETADLFEGSGIKGVGTTPADQGKQGGKSPTGKPRYVKFSDKDAIAQYSDEIANNEITVIEG